MLQRYIASWILSSVMKKDGSKHSLHDQLREVWDELEGRFEQSNGPNMYMQEELITTAQGSMSVELITFHEIDDGSTRSE